MRKSRFGTDEPGRREAGEEDSREHERNRRLKRERDRLLRRQLARLRASRSGDELEDAVPARA